MNVLIACEFSAVVRNAFIERGHNAWSCDLLPTEGRQGNHFVGDVTRILAGNIPSDMGENAINIRTGNSPMILKWDLLIAHPPCTYLCNSGVRWMYNADGSPNYERKMAFRDAAHFFVQLKQAPEQLCWGHFNRSPSCRCGTTPLWKECLSWLGVRLPLARSRPSDFWLTKQNWRSLASLATNSSRCSRLVLRICRSLIACKVSLFTRKRTQRVLTTVSALSFASKS